MNVLVVHRDFSPSAALNAMAARLEALVAKWPAKDLFDSTMDYHAALFEYSISQAVAGRQGERGPSGGGPPGS